MISQKVAAPSSLGRAARMSDVSPEQVEIFVRAHHGLTGRSQGSLRTAGGGSGGGKAPGTAVQGAHAGADAVDGVIGVVRHQVSQPAVPAAAADGRNGCARRRRDCWNRIACDMLENSVATPS